MIKRYLCNSQTKYISQIHNPLHILYISFPKVYLFIEIVTYQLHKIKRSTLVSLYKYMPNLFLGF